MQLLKIFDTLIVRFPFLNRENSPSFKALVKGDNKGTIYQNIGDVHVHEGIRSNQVIKVDLSKSKEFVLTKLTEEWNLDKTGFRQRQQFSDGTYVEQGLEVIILPARLRGWVRESGLTISQFEPILDELRHNGRIKDFEFYDGQWTEDDDFTETGLRIEFDINFLNNH